MTQLCNIDIKTTLKKPDLQVEQVLRKNMKICAVKFQKLESAELFQYRHIQPFLFVFLF